MKASTENTIRINRLEILKKAAFNNSKRIRRRVLKGAKTTASFTLWERIGFDYQREINQLKQS